MVKRSVFGRGVRAQASRLGGGVKLAMEGGAAASGHIPRGAKVPGRARTREGSGAQAGAHSCFRALQPAQHADTSPETQLGALPVSPSMLTPNGGRHPQDHGAAPEALQAALAPAVSGTVAHGRDPMGSGPPAPGETLPAGRSEPQGDIPGQGTFRTASEGRVGSGTSPGLGNNLSGGQARSHSLQHSASQSEATQPQTSQRT